MMAWRHRRRFLSTSRGGCGEAGERRRGGGMVEGVVRERLYEGRHLRAMGDGGGGRRIRWWRRRRKYLWLPLFVLFGLFLWRAYGRNHCRPHRSEHQGGIGSGTASYLAHVPAQFIAYNVQIVGNHELLPGVFVNERKHRIHGLDQ
jgi:hypothetical protein